MSLTRIRECILEDNVLFLHKNRIASAFRTHNLSILFSLHPIFSSAAQDMPVVSVEVSY